MYEWTHDFLYNKTTFCGTLFLAFGVLVLIGLLIFAFKSNKRNDL